MSEVIPALEEVAMARVIARQAIRDVLSRYCRGLDRMDKAMAYSVFHADASALYHDMYEGSGHGFVDWVWEAHRYMERHSHQITNVLAEVNGDTASSEAYVTVVLWTLPDDAGEQTEIVVRGRYLDRWKCIDGQWMIMQREHVLDMHSEYTLKSGPVGPASRRDSSDPSFAYIPAA
jgi:hypothetical protein